jgi:hypothetical protein
MNAENARNSEELLESKSRDELNIIAKKMKIAGFRTLSKISLISAILEADPNGKVINEIPSSWWHKYHNHVYGVATLIGLLLTIAFFVLQNSGHNSQSQGSRGQVTSAPTQTRENSNGNQPSMGSDSNNTEQIEARIASEAQSFSPMSMKEYFDSWFNATSLQRDELEAEMLRKTVIWTGKIDSIESGKEGAVEVVVRNMLGGGTAFLDFDSSQRSSFLKLKKGQSIRFTGIIRSFIASPFLEKCRLLQVLD